ncbi:MAG: hypothetical protein N2692_00070 [Patescibacteria group bacterium]|jgi:hypothetical protein|nr:hypothetical protein [Patescibacteria group bacterium]
MILSVHFITGAAITKIIPNKLIAYPLAFLIHFLLDALPHTDYSLRGISSGWKKKNFYESVFSLILDTLFGIAFIIIWAMAFDNFNITSALVGGFLGILPDFLNLISYLFHNKNFLLFIKGHPLTDLEEFKTQSQNLYYRFHHWIHNGSESSNSIGIATQIVIFLAALIILLK